MHQILLLQRGAGRLTVDNDTTQLVAPVLVAVPSLCVHAFAFDPGSEGWVISFAIDLLHDPRMAAARQLALFSRQKAVQAQMSADGGELERLSWLMADFAAAEADLRAEQMPASRVAELGFILACADSVLEEQQAQGGGSRQQQMAGRFRALVEEAFRKGWKISDYAARLATTEQTLNRACRSVFGQSPGELVQQRLVVEAMRYLKFSGASMKEISMRLGFSDPAYFARFFKKTTGKTASQFRRESQGQKAPETGTESRRS